LGLGWEVRVIDQRPADEVDLPGIDYRSCDITHYPALRDQMRDCEAVIHLAAISAPMAMAGPELFPINVTGTYNVFEAAAAEGIRRVVQASSLNAFGCFWGTVDITPHYLPLDEAHPTFTTDVYSFSKGLAEEIGDYYWRRDGISSVAFRFPGVGSATFLSSEGRREWQQQTRTVIDEFAAQSDSERATRLAEIRHVAREFRRQRNMEYPLALQNLRDQNFSDDPLWRVYTFERFNFWTYVDERDAAQAMEKGITANFEGSHALFINARQNALRYDAQTLARLFFPETVDWRDGLSGAASLVSAAKAHELISFEPEY
jgi:hypothetical protein